MFGSHFFLSLANSSGLPPSTMHATLVEFWHFSLA